MDLNRKAQKQKEEKLENMRLRLKKRAMEA